MKAYNFFSISANFNSYFLYREYFFIIKSTVNTIKAKIMRSYLSSKHKTSYLQFNPEKINLEK